MALTQDQFNYAANRINVDVAAVKAVARVESTRGGFDKLGRLTILFEPHIFWKHLLKAGIDPVPIKNQYPDLVNPIWNKTLYGPENIQWDKLILARTINTNAANLSASFGAFQIMGFNYSVCGFNSVDTFIDFLQQGEANQLDVFCQYLFNRQLVDELRNLDWGGFARGYNGEYYWKNQYDIKLRKAYEYYKNNPNIVF